MAGSIRPETGATIAKALLKAQSGRAGRACAEMKALLRDLGREPSYARAAAEHALAIAANHHGDTAAALRAATGCITLGEVLGEHGWVANGRAARALILLGDGRFPDAVDDVVAAEYELGRSDDDGLSSWAHSGLGMVYEKLGLFELATPHFEAASALDTAPLPLREAPFVEAVGLASVNLVWAVELTMLMDEAHQGKIAALRAEAIRWAEHALALTDRHGAAAGMLPRVRFFRAAAAWADDPARWIGELHACRASLSGVGDDSRALAATAALAEAATEVGDLVTARREADRALRGLDDTTDARVERYVRWATLRVQAVQGEPAAIDGLAYARTVSVAWRGQIAGDLEVMRAAISGYARAQEGALHKRAAREDALTGLGNRRAFDEWIGAAVGDSCSLTLLLIDVDDLKRINDTYGHVAGDEVLSEAAALIEGNIRATDRAARVGGDEFVVLLMDPADDDAQLVVDRIQLAASVTGSADHLSRLGLSIGIASTLDGIAVQDLLSAADRRMYEDKRRRARAENGAATGSEVA